MRDTGAHWSTRNDRPAAQASQPTSESGSKKAWTPEKRSIGGTGAGSVRTAPAQGHGGGGRSLDPPQERPGSGRSLDASQASGASRVGQGGLSALAGTGAKLTNTAGTVMDVRGGVGAGQGISPRGLGRREYVGKPPLPR